MMHSPLQGIRVDPDMRALTEGLLHGPIALGSSFKGRLSCLQMFTRFMTAAEVKHYSDCHESNQVKTGCPWGYEAYQDTCYKVQYTFSVS